LTLTILMQVTCSLPSTAITPLPQSTKQSAPGWRIGTFGLTVFRWDRAPARLL
jgi:hypothetical protein